MCVDLSRWNRAPKHHDNCHRWSLVFRQFADSDSHFTPAARVYDQPKLLAR
jgi:hypothetical protein